MNHRNRSQRLLSLAVAAASLSAVETSAQALEEVVVTAQRQAQTLSDVPIAVTAFSAEGLKNFAVDDLSDLNLASPSFMATPFLSDPWVTRLCAFEASERVGVTQASKARLGCMSMMFIAHARVPRC